MIDPHLALVAASLQVLRSQKDLAERAIIQVGDAELHTPLDSNTNSIAVIMQHMAGNMLSRWVDFLTSDGEKPDRDRDSEFIDQGLPREKLMQRWEAGWRAVFNALEALSPDDMSATVLVRGEPHSVTLAVARQLSHYGYHVGQIVLIARILARDNWTTLSIPRGGSRQYNDRTWVR